MLYSFRRDKDREEGRQLVICNLFYINKVYARRIVFFFYDFKVLTRKSIYRYYLFNVILV